jgi:hypothetical protein
MSHPVQVPPRVEREREKGKLALCPSDRQAVIRGYLLVSLLTQP